MFCALNSSINCIMKNIVLHLALLFFSLCFWGLSMLMHIIPIHFFWRYPIVWINQFSIPVSLNIISGLLSKPLWFSLSGRLFPSSSFWLALSPPSGHNSEKVPRLPYLKHLLSMTTLSKWLFFLSHQPVNFFYFSFSPFVYCMVPPEMLRTLRSGTLVFFCLFVHLCILKWYITLAKCMSH